ncbi:alkaline phosphatase D family protein [Tautonia sociabilis]|uniref:Alkaline phosphatase n=1 Tax=Tautonia sociabilis TaxID=2080755 RepID=A0A432MH35_9BACT|nr:alkaline phosphatase D family protein [Tautonia sociabilis]RUL86287.1 alkaline phosphatase [Tautonia sociabilis]
MFDPSDLRAAARSEGGVSRRLFLSWAAALPGIAVLGQRAEGRTLRHPTFSSDPFSSGVASGDPTPRGVVLWTRLAPEPLEPGGGMAPELVEVGWEVASDEGFSNIVRRGSSVATPQLGHSVHVEVDGLEPGRWYWYRFHSGAAESPVGRTRTMPRSDEVPDRLTFAFASCQHFESGLYTAYEYMLADDPDLVFHLGDYIYEGAARAGGVREHIGDEIRSLDDYRIRYALYRGDEHLRAMHASCPWVVTWDDHEFDNNYAGAISEEEGTDPVAFLERRANAYQAYYEMMPLRRRSLPRGPELRLYRSIDFGRLASFQVLDTRQYRTDQPNGDRRSPINEQALDPKGSLLGREQLGWLKSRLLASTSTWNVLAQQVMMGMVGFRTDGVAEPIYSMDQWPGYAAERMALVEFLRDRKVPNPVVLTGDIHSNWANELRVDDRQHDAPVVAAEFVGTSISSGGNGSATVPGLEERLSANPCVRFFNAQRGYVRCSLSPTEWRTDYRVVEQVTTPGAPAVTKASFVVEAGKAGMEPA